MKEVLIDLPGVETFLRERFGAGVEHVQELGRGEWSVAFAYRYAGRDAVARFGFFDEDFRKDHCCKLCLGAGTYTTYSRDWAV